MDFGGGARGEAAVGRREGQVLCRRPWARVTIGQSRRVAIQTFYGHRASLRIDTCCCASERDSRPAAESGVEKTEEPGVDPSRGR